MVDRKKMDELIESNAFARYIGMELTRVEQGYAEGRIRMEKRHTNVYEGMHGGCVYALADTIAGIAAATCGRYVTTLSGGMNYMLPIKDTEYVICKARTIRQGGRIAVLDVAVENEKGEILSNGSFNYYCTGKKLEEGHGLREMTKQ